MPLSFTSAKTTSSPKFNTQLAEIINDLGVTITLSPFFKSNALKASSKATLPLETATEYLFPTYFENCFSNEIPSFCETIQLHIHFKSNPEAPLACSWYAKPYNATEEIWVGITQSGGGSQDDEHLNFTSRFTVIEGKVQVIGRSAQTAHQFWGSRIGFFLPRGI